MKKELELCSVMQVCAIKGLDKAVSLEPYERSWDAPSLARDKSQIQDPGDNKRNESTKDCQRKP